jgi:hypothetical protein
MKGSHERNKIIFLKLYICIDEMFALEVSIGIGREIEQHEGLCGRCAGKVTSLLNKFFFFKELSSLDWGISSHKFCNSIAKDTAYV